MSEPNELLIRRGSNGDPGLQIRVTDAGIEKLRYCCEGYPVAAFIADCWPVNSVYEGTADPNVWCGGTWVLHPNGKTWKRTA